MVKRTRLPYTTQKRNARTGRLEWWFRRGKVWKLLPGDPGADEAAQALYWRPSAPASTRGRQRARQRLSSPPTG